MEVITVKLPRRLLRIIDDFVAKGIFPSRSEFIRYAIFLLVSFLIADTEEVDNFIRKIRKRLESV